MYFTSLTSISIIAFASTLVSSKISLMDFGQLRDSDFNFKNFLYIYNISADYLSR